MPSYYQICSSVPSVKIPLSSQLFPSVKIPLSSQLCSVSQHSALQSALFIQSTFHSPVGSVTSHQTNDAVNVTFLQTSTFFLYTKAVELLCRPSTARASGRPPVTSCVNSGAATVVPTVCSEQASILHHICLFMCFYCQ